MYPSRQRLFILFGLEPEEKSWRGIALLAGFYLGAILFAAVLSPLVYWVVQTWADATPNKINTYLAGKELPRYFDRLRWLPILVFLPWLLKKCGLWSFHNLGLRAERTFWKPMLTWAFVGTASLVAVGAAQAVAAGVEPRPSLTAMTLLDRALAGLLGGLVIGLLEETIFRGMILRMFYTAMGPLTAAVLSSLFFAYVHFKKIPREIWEADTAVTIGSGFYAAYWTLLSVTQTFDLMRFVNLFFVGLVLCLLFLKTGSLWPCVGLHTGWVCFRAVYEKFVNVADAGPLLLRGTEIMIDGLLATFMLAALAAWLFYQLKRNDYRPDSEKGA